VSDSPNDLPVARLYACSMPACFFAFAVLIVRAWGQDHCTCIKGEHQLGCPVVEEDGVCPLSLLGKFVNVENFFWRKYGLNGFHLIETTAADVDSNMHEYPCSYYTSADPITEFTFHSMDGVATKVENVEFTKPYTTYSKNTWWYSYCREPQVFNATAYWKFMVAVPNGTVYEHDFSQGTTFTDSESYTKGWTAGATGGISKGGGSASASFSYSASNTIQHEVGQDSETSEKITITPPLDGQHVIWQFCVSTVRNYCSKTETETCSENFQFTGDRLVNPRCLPGYCQMNDQYCQTCTDDNYTFPVNETKMVIASFNTSYWKDTSCWLDDVDSGAWAYNCIKTTDPTVCKAQDPNSRSPRLNESLLI